MKINYLVEVENPRNHLVKVTLSGERKLSEKHLDLFLPVWSPGSYLIREYSRHIRSLRAEASNGEVLYLEQKSKSTWRIDWHKSELNKQLEGFSLVYEVYCHDFTVRTSHVDESHAFLHGPNYLMGVLDREIEPQIQFSFPQLWSHFSTSLEDISPSREIFLYKAKDYDTLLDCPVEIGCQQTDGFMFKDRPHELAFYGSQWPHDDSLKEDIKKIVQKVSDLFSGDLPYQKYTFLAHFAQDLYGGLEHISTSVLQFDGRRMANRKDYLDWLSLVAHEYFHTWNIKLIRPLGLGPFNYHEENYTRMLWLAEGLTSFMDELIVYRCGLCSLDEYLELIRSGFERYFLTPGKKFHSLEDSSFNAWIKSYRPDENTQNSSVSYYNKGSLVFFVLNILLQEAGSNINQFIEGLWQLQQVDMSKGLTEQQVYDLVAKISNIQVAETLEEMVTTTIDIDIEMYCKKIGLEFIWENQFRPWLGIECQNRGERIIINKVVLDGPGYKYGLNAGDEIIAVNGQRILWKDYQKLASYLNIGGTYLLTISRNGTLAEVNIMIDKAPRRLLRIHPYQVKLVEKSLL